MSRLQHVPLHRPADRVRTIEHDHRDALRPGGPHHVHRGGEIGVVPGARVLEIDQQQVDSGEHLVGGGGSPAVKTIDWKPSGRIDRRRDRRAGIGRATESVLGAEQRHQPDSRRPQSHHVADTARIHARLVGHQADPPVADQAALSVSRTSIPGRTEPGSAGAAGIRRRASDRPGQLPAPGNETCAPQAPHVRDGIALRLRRRRPSPRPRPQPEPFRPEVRAVPDVDDLIATLSVRDKIAQLVVPWIPGTYAAYDAESFARMEVWVDSLHVGGLIVSVGSPLDIAAKLNRLQERSALPLLIASDLEGGTSIRFNGGTPLPPNMGVAATGSDSAAYEMGRITALEGRAVGVHLAFAPVADVNNNPDNPIINTRSFGEDPAAVGRMVAAEVRESANPASKCWRSFSPPALSRRVSGKGRRS